MTDANATTSDATTLVRLVLLDAFGRVAEEVPQVLDGLGGDDILWRPDPGSNSIGWLIWHLSRVQDDHLAALAAQNGHLRAQVWEQWRERFGLPYPPDSYGFGQSAEEVGQFDVSDPALLAGYHAEVADATVQIVEQLTAADYERVIDDRWDPPVTTAARLVSVVNDTTAHVGQSAYLRGLLEHR